jgi:hypothetical protein
MKIGSSDIGITRGIKEFFKELWPFDLDFCFAKYFVFTIPPEFLGGFNETWYKERSQCVYDKMCILQGQPCTSIGGRFLCLIFL